ncbi:MAG: putative selenium-dependent hydroxylase accessory protein YqeC [Spirochaetaceae bacterium]|jgi:probable selenium-dependent hydroxylase accessory protein YqeC|nr:putative selenium-dependent hydroxylase accessory protein YqeC [Spirochaetaceae bacterium]
MMNQTVRLGDFFQRYRDEVITVIGSGGKTSLLWFLARCFAGNDNDRERRVLVTTTTKMGAPDCGSGLFDHFTDGSGLETPQPGVTFAGSHEDGSRKTAALPPSMLASLIRRFDVTLIEGDGSRTLPLKGWADYEPVVAPDTTVTVGIIPLWPVGMPVSAALVHRLPLFTALTGAREGDILTAAHLAAAITGIRGGTGRRGLFAEARGKRVLFFNQAETGDALRLAEEVAAHVLAETAPATRLDTIIAGSVKQNEVSVLADGLPVETVACSVR